MPIITKEYAIIGAVTVLFIFGFMFLFSGLRLSVPSLEGNFLLVIVGVLFFVLAVFLARKYWSVIKQSIE
jgi:NADH:ubiquinone oxidoreductase subunit 6 (subunit J)